MSQRTLDMYVQLSEDDQTTVSNFRRKRRERKTSRDCSECGYAVCRCNERFEKENEKLSFIEVLHRKLTRELQ